MPTLLVEQRQEAINIDLGSALSRTESHECCVHHFTMQPRRELGFLSEMRERPEGIKKCVLYGITCIIFIMGQNVCSTGDGNLLQLEDLRVVKDPRDLDLFHQVLFGRQLLHQTLLSPYLQPGLGEMIPPPGVAHPADL